MSPEQDPNPSVLDTPLLDVASSQSAISLKAEHLYWTVMGVRVSWAVGSNLAPVCIFSKHPLF